MTEIMALADVLVLVVVRVCNDGYHGAGCCCCSGCGTGAQ